MPCAEPLHPTPWGSTGLAQALGMPATQLPLPSWLQCKLRLPLELRREQPEEPAWLCPDVTTARSRGHEESEVENSTHLAA